MQRTSSSDDWDRVWVGMSVATMVAGRTAYGRLEHAALAVKGENIAWIGSADDGRRLAASRAVPTEDVAGLWMTPGLIDCHTHLVYGGNRVAEFEQRLCGVPYEEIARSGGGIQSTVNATRSADFETLSAAARGRVRRLMSEGVTTLEVKSGYGLDLPSERRMLEVARALARELPISIETTFLGLHALPVEFRDRRREYVAAVSGPWLESLAAAGLVDAVDAFCETIAFTLEETEAFLGAAQRLGLRAHVHAGQLSDMGAAELAARYRALSADHLEYLSAGGARALATAGTVAVLLPGAYFTLRQTTSPPVPLLRAAGVPIAVSTDGNPGTSPGMSLLLALNMGCTLFGLTPEEALAGATREAARALGREGLIGTLEVGKRADFALWRIERPAELCYNLGANPCAGVVYKGKARAT
ncbi:MAG TPA: imidazolonepropionase [Steroidobacteraceae bacterium]|nr:imidazolonepropionase [Steroidobacteraceae bacterium]